MGPFKKQKRRIFPEPTASPLLSVPGAGSRPQRVPQAIVRSFLDVNTLATAFTCDPSTPRSPRVTLSPSSTSFFSTSRICSTLIPDAAATSCFSSPTVCKAVQGARRSVVVVEVPADDLPTIVSDENAFGLPDEQLDAEAHLVRGWALQWGQEDVGTVAPAGRGTGCGTILPPLAASPQPSNPPRASLRDVGAAYGREPAFPTTT